MTNEERARFEQRAIEAVEEYKTIVATIQEPEIQSLLRRMNMSDKEGFVWLYSRIVPGGADIMTAISKWKEAIALHEKAVEHET